MAGIIGLRGSGEFNTDFRPTNYRELFTLLEPNGSAPLNALLAMSQSEATDDPKFSNFRDELPSRTMQINMGSGAAANVTALTVDAGGDLNFVVPGTIIVVERTGEVMRASANGASAGANILTVTRNISGTSLTINDNDKLFIAGHASKEGDSVPNPISFDPSVASNFTQIFRTSYKVTGTLDNTYRRTGDAEDEFSTKALKLHMSDIERAFFFGVKHEDTSTLGSTSQPLRYTGGLVPNISSNVLAGASQSTANQITEDDFDRFLIESVFAFGSKEKIAFVGAKVAGHLQKFGKNRWSPTQVEGTYGVNFTRYQTMAGDLLVHLHPQFRQVPDYENQMVILDFPFLRYRYMQNRDTQLLMDRQSPGDDAKHHEYLSECGLEMLQEKVHSKITDWQTTT